MKYFVSIIVLFCMHFAVLKAQDGKPAIIYAKTTEAPSHKEPIEIPTLKIPNPSLKTPPLDLVWKPVGGIGEKMIVGQTIRDVAVAPNGDIYVLGAFEQPYNSLAKWNGASWESLSFSAHGPVYDIEVTSDGILYVAGNFCFTDDLNKCYLVKWDGLSWSEVPQISSNSVTALGLDQNGKLLVGGNSLYFPSQFISGWSVGRFDGTDFIQLGNSQSFNGRIHVLATDAMNNVYAGGEFSKYGTTNAGHIAKFDGTTWSGMAQGVNSTVTSISTHNSDVVAGGSFVIASGQVTKGIAKWNGTSWSALGSGLSGGAVKAVYYDEDGVLWAGGSFVNSGTNALKFLGYWDGSNWQQVPSGADSTVTVFKTNLNGHMLVGGHFIQIGPLATPHLVEKNGTAWKTIGKGLTNCCYFKPIAIDSSNNIYMGGHYKDTDNPVLMDQDLIKWNGSAWSPVGSGLQGNVRALEINSSGKLYAGGSITVAGSNTIHNIAQWDGVSWKSLGQGTDGPVQAIALDSDSSLYAGGYFQHTGTSTAHNIAHWNGSAWAPLPTGTNRPIQAMTFHSGLLYAAGDFTQPVYYLAKWDGNAWSTVGSNGSPNKVVRCLKTDHTGNLYAGGNFTAIGADSLNHIARFNGQIWESLGSGLPGPVLFIEIDAQNQVYASYSLRPDDGESRVAKWDGTNWAILENVQSINHYVTGMRVNHQGQLYAAGTFTTPYPTLMTYGACDQQLHATISEVVLPSCDADSVVISPFVCGGTGQLKYRWDNGATTPSIKVLPLETSHYCVTITDEGNGYQATCVRAVREPYWCGNKLTSITVDAVTEHSISVSWTLPDSVATPVVVISLYSINYNPVMTYINLPGSTHQYTFEGLVCDSNYMVIVNPNCLCNAQNYTSYNETILPVKTDSCIVGVSNLSGQDVQLKVNPQPVKSYLTLDSGGSTGPGTLTIYHANGTVAMRQPWTGGARQTIPAESLPSGMYWINLQTEHASRSVRFIKL
jgi:hypothetical protein